MKAFYQISMLLVITFSISACGVTGSNDFTSNDVLREAVLVPDAFLPAGDMAFDATSCKSPLLDPQDGEEIVMIRSSAASLGDYEVPEGKYGVSKDELLRVDCRTGKVVGIVLR